MEAHQRSSHGALADEALPMYEKMLIAARRANLTWKYHDVEEEMVRRFFIAAKFLRKEQQIWLLEKFISQCVMYERFAEAITARRARRV